MTGPSLRDAQEYPSDDVLARHLGKAKPAWDELTARLAAGFPDASLEWRYYQDGKAWLCKLVRKKKTVCWVSIWDQAFKTTFYFTAKNDEDLARLPIARERKDAYLAQAASGKLKPITIEVRRKKDLGDVFALLDYKRGSRR